ncbi:MAG: hypothetical protein FWE24_06460 [Defluviitaleaceae bacterium]|nr:hypothetical protein [Defluviitaleaceae bacterium]
MREFYRLETIDFGDFPFAFCDLPINTNNYADTGFKCSKCSAPIGALYWLEPRRVILSKPRYGDFVSGQRYLFSEKVKTAYEQSDLKGVKAFIPVEIAKVRYMHKGSPKPPQYYALELEYSYAGVDIEKSVVRGNPHEGWCTLCNPFRNTKNEIRGIYIDDTNWGGEDIFHLYEMGGSVYASQKFIDFCEEHKFTNFNYINTKDYVFDFFGSFI